VQLRLNDLVVAVALFASLAAAPLANAQTPINADDPKITQKPRPGPDSPGPEFPSEALRNREFGETKLSICVDASGKTHSPSISSTSGSSALDAAALTWVAEDAKFLPAEIDGQAVDVCNYTFSMVWKEPMRGDDRMLQPVLALSYWNLFPDVSDLREENRPILQNPPPQNLPYPHAALVAGAEGPVTYSLCLDDAGNILDLRPMTPNAHWSLTTATLSWLRSLKYSPAMRGGKKAAVCGVEATYQWQLPDTTSPG
jgi:TonB family protein